MQRTAATVDETIELYIKTLKLVALIPPAHRECFKEININDFLSVLLV